MGKRDGWKKWRNDFRGLVSSTSLWTTEEEQIFTDFTLWIIHGVKVTDQFLNQKHIKPTAPKVIDIYIWLHEIKMSQR